MLTINKYEEKTKEEALKKCLLDLNVSENDLYLRYGETEAKLFKGKKQYVEALRKEDVIDYIRDYLKNISQGMNIDIHSEIKEQDGIINVLLASDNNSILIGKDGRTLNALQILLRQVVNIQSDFTIKVILDASNYKAKKQKSLEYEIKGIVRDVLRSKIEVKLDPMNSYDRRIVHSIVAEYPELETESFGEAPNRYVVIRYKKD